MQWLHSVAALSPLQCQRTVKPGQSSAQLPPTTTTTTPQPLGGVSSGWDSISQGHTMRGCSPTVLLEPLPKCAALQMGSVHILVQDGAESSATARR